MTYKQKITEILKAYTKKHNISASSVILEEYAEELAKNDVVKVVRCKDCRYCRTLTHDLTTSYFCEVLKRPAVVEPTDFCSYGELKELGK